MPVLEEEPSCTEVQIIYALKCKIGPGTRCNTMHKVLYATIDLIGALIEVFISKRNPHATHEKFTRLLTYRYICRSNFE